MGLANLYRQSSQTHSSSGEIELREQTDTHRVKDEASSEGKVEDLDSDSDCDIEVDSDREMPEYRKPSVSNLVEPQAEPRPNSHL